MSVNQEKIRALGLCSGGLDSILSAMVIQKQGIHVEWISFETPFFSSDKARKAADNSRIPLMVKNITESYMKMLRNPKGGYGKNMNPCMDCHALMFKLAGEIMTEKGFHFLFSGEVLGQRPMSQTRPSLKYVEKHSGMGGYILRPLSARKLDETIPEKKGWVAREKLLDIAGRGRKRQIQLAREFGVEDYPAPAGGCLLTDKGFCHRLEDLLSRKENVTNNELILLKFGRHFRTPSGTKIVVGRTQEDNESILAYLNPQNDTKIRLSNYAGPVVLVCGYPSDGELYLAAGMCAGYSKLSEKGPVEVTVENERECKKIRVLPIQPSDVKHMLV